MDHMMQGMGGSDVGWLVAAVVVAFVVLAGVVIAKAVASSRRRPLPEVKEAEARRRLDARLVDGEIDDDEYLRVRSVLDV